MKTVEYCVCDGCNKPIIDEFDGLIIHGGIYTADPKKNGGLIGNCFDPDKNGMVEYNKIAETVLCMKCFEQTINKIKEKVYWEDIKKLDESRKIDESERWEHQ